jgi:hypothetical protein
MDFVVIAVNLIKKSAFSHHQFQQFLLETETESGDVFYYSESGV